MGFDHYNKCMSTRTSDATSNNTVVSTSHWDVLGSSQMLVALKPIDNSKKL